MSNMGDGFLGFQARMAAIVEALGEPRLQPYVAAEFRDRLVKEMERARGIRGYQGRGRGLPMFLEWTLATAAEFDQAGRAADDMLTVGRNIPVTAQARFMGTTLVLRDTAVWAEGGGYRLLVLHAYEGHPSYDRRSREMVTKWDVSLVREWQNCFPTDSGKPTSTHAKSKDAAVKAMKRMAKDFMGVELV